MKENFRVSSREKGNGTPPFPVRQSHERTDGINAPLFLRSAGKDKEQSSLLDLARKGKEALQAVPPF